MSGCILSYMEYKYCKTGCRRLKKRILVHKNENKIN